MGIINNNAYTTPHGDSVTGTYLSISTGNLSVRKNIRDNSVYDISGSFLIWKDKAAKVAGKTYYDRVNFSQSYNSSQISTGVYSLLYTYIKTVYTNTSDGL